MLTLKRFFCLILILTQALQLLAQEQTYVNKIRFTGKPSLEKRALKKIMHTQSRSFFDKVIGSNKKELFSPTVFNDDIDRITKHYQRNGFLDASVTYSKIGSKNKGLKLEIEISEGKAVSIGQIHYVINQDTSLQHPPFYNKTIPLVSSTHFKDEKVLKAEAQITEYYLNNGYPFIKTEHKIELIDNQQQADIFLTINTGNKTVFGSIKQQGNKYTSKDFIAKHIDIKKGAPYSQKKIDATQTHLYNLALHNYIIIQALRDSVKNDSIPMLIRFGELPRWALKLEAGYGTEDRFRTSMLLTRLNVFGGGRKIILKAQHSYFYPIQLDVKFIQPDIYYMNLDFIVNPYFIRQREESFKVDRLGSMLTFQKQYSTEQTASLSYSYGEDRVTLTTKDKSVLNGSEFDNNVKSGISLGYLQNATDNKFFPENGWKFEGMASYMGLGFNSQQHFYKVIGEIDFYYPLSEKIVLAHKFKIGSLIAAQKETIPIEDRFLSGGASSLRGWGRNQISPVNALGDKLGGNSLMEVGIELRYPIIGIVGGTLFYDMGNVWKKTFDYDLSHLRQNIGIGLTAKTPIGPIRLDVASPIYYGAFNANFFISIGHAF